MKDENNGAIITEFVRLRAKMYALRVEGKKAKGVKSDNRGGNVDGTHINSSMLARVVI